MGKRTDFLSDFCETAATSSLDDLIFCLFTSKKDPPKIESLPPTNNVTLQHIKCTCLQVLLGTAADQSSPPKLYILNMVGGQRKFQQPCLGFISLHLPIVCKLLHVAANLNCTASPRNAAVGQMDFHAHYTVTVELKPSVWMTIPGSSPFGDQCEEDDDAAFFSSLNWVDIG